MNNIRDLIKVYLIEDFKLNKLFKKKNILKMILSILLALIVVTFILFMFGSVYYSVLIMSDPNHVLKNIVSITFSVISLFLIITNLTKVGSYLFKGKDLDILLSLPISTKEIIISKISSLLISNYLSVFVVSLPSYIVIGLNMSIRPMFYFEFTLALLVLPLLIISVLAVFSYYLNIFFNRFRIKNFLQITLGVIFLSAYMIFSTTVGSENELLWLSLSDKLKYVYPLILLAINGITSKPLLLLLFISINILSFTIFVYVISKVFLKVNTGLVQHQAKNQIIKKQVKLKKKTFTLFKLELKKFFNKPMYVLNSSISKVLFPILLISLLFTKINMTEDIGFDINSIYILILTGIAIFTLTTTSTTAVTLSLEGKNIWFLKTLPVSYKDILISKGLIDIMITYIIAIPTAIVSVYVLKMPILYSILFISLILMIGIYNSSLGLLLNLKFPKMEFDQEIKVIKQSLTVFLHMIFSMLNIVILVLVSVLLIKINIVSVEVLPIVLLSIFNILFLIYLIVIYLILKFNANKWFDKL